MTAPNIIGSYMDRQTERAEAAMYAACMDQLSDRAVIAMHAAACRRATEGQDIPGVPTGPLHGTMGDGPGQWHRVDEPPPFIDLRTGGNMRPVYRPSVAVWVVVAVTWPVIAWGVAWIIREGAAIWQ